MVKFIIALSSLLFLAACATGEEANNEVHQEDTISVVTSIYPVYEIVNEIASDRLELSLMVGESEDAHHYEPSAQTVATVNEADVFIYSSDVMEFWAEDLLAVVENENLNVIELAENLDLTVSENTETGSAHHHEADHSIMIEGLRDHYHTGDIIELIASHESDEDHWHWFTREEGAEEWVVVENQLSDYFEMEATLDGQEIKAELYNDEHELIAESEPVRITIDDHEHEEDDHDHEGDVHSHDRPVEQTIVIDGLAGHYHTGDIIELIASHNSEYDHWHWFTRENSAEEWEIVGDQMTEILSGTALVDGLEIKAELYDDNHELIAGSTPVTIVIDDHEEGHAHSHDHEGETLDPHFWLDPVAVNEILPVIVEALSNADPEGTEIYQENANIFSEALQELDAAYQEAFEGASNRSFVVQHQAFGHLANRYDLEQVSVGGLMTEIEPNPQALVDVATFVRENNIPIIYYQDGENSATAETIATETGTEVATLYDLESSPVENNFGDSVYIEAMYHNLDQLKKSIQ